MTTLEKINYLRLSTNLSERKFCKKYSIKFSQYKKWEKNLKNPSATEIGFLCEQFNLNIDEFLDDKIDIKNVSKYKKEDTDGHVIYEDYPNEDNSRYEEKD